MCSSRNIHTPPRCFCFAPPHLQEFPMAVSGGSMDTFWKHTIYTEWRNKTKWTVKDWNEKFAYCVKVFPTHYVAPPWFWAGRGWRQCPGLKKTKRIKKSFDLSCLLTLQKFKNVMLTANCDIWHLSNLVLQEATSYSASACTCICCCCCLTNCCLLSLACRLSPWTCGCCCCCFGSFPFLFLSCLSLNIILESRFCMVGINFCGLKCNTNRWR